MKGEVAILCNGPTLADYNLAQIPMETIGLNRSWELLRSSYHVMADPEQWQAYERVAPIGAIRNLYTGEDGPETATRLRWLDSDRPRWSWWPFELGVYLCGCVTWAALQIAVGLGKTTIYLVGMDMQPREASGKFYGGEWPRKAEAKQRELMGYAAGLLEPNGIRLINVTPPNLSRCRAFERMTFEEAFLRERPHGRG